MSAFLITFLSILVLALMANISTDWDFSKSCIDTGKIQSGEPPYEGALALFIPRAFPAK